MDKTTNQAETFAKRFFDHIEESRRVLERVKLSSDEVINCLKWMVKTHGVESVVSDIRELAENIEKEQKDTLTKLGNW